MRSRKELEGYIRQDDVILEFGQEIECELLLDIRELLQQMLRERK